MGLWEVVFGIGRGEFIYQAVGLLDGVYVRVEVEHGLKFNGFLSVFEVGEEALEDVWAIIRPHVNPYGDILDVGEETVALDETHWIGIILFGSVNEIFIKWTIKKNDIESIFITWFIFCIYDLKLIPDILLW